MATIQASIAITDGATGPLRRMAQAAEVTTGRFEKAAAAANQIDNAVSQKVGSIASNVRAMGPAFNSVATVAEQLADSINRIGAASSVARMGVVGIGVAMTVAFGAVMTLLSLIMTALRTISGAFRLSDELSQTTARLNLMNDGLQTTAQLQAMIFASAQRSRSEYQATADFVAKIGMRAGSIFNSNAELIGVAETINKIFKISGTSAQEQASATLQLSQALASGVLRGEELNAVFEAAPMMIRKIADYLQVDIGQIREMAQDGMLTAEIVKNAMIAASGEVNRTFETIPKTWGDIWTSFKNTSIRGLQPLFETMSSLANNQGVQAFVSGIATGIAYSGAIIVGVINMLRWLASVAGEVGSYIGSWLSAGFIIAGENANYVFPVLVGWLSAYAIWEGVLGASILARSAAEAASLGWLWLQIQWLTIKQAVTRAAGLSELFLAACIWIAMNPMIAMAAIIGVLIGVFAFWQVSTIGLRNTIASAFSSIAETTGNAVNFMIRRVNDLIGILNKAATLINGVFGTSISVVGTIGEVDAKSWGKSAGDFVKNFDLKNFGKMLGLPEMPGVNDYVPTTVTDIANAGNATADNTKGIKDAMEITDEDIKYMRDIAEQDVINRYTTAEVKIEMGGIHNSVSSDMDLDGMVRYINDSLFDAMVSGAEKVHP